MTLDPFVIQRLLPDVPLHWYGPERAGQIPTGPGAYLLLVTLDKTVPFHASKIGSIHVMDGLYVYAGSARGPGGLQSRLNRHFAREKAIHWHVDQLTVAAEYIGALVSYDISECELVDLLNGTGAFRSAIDGFGSSDCRRCTSHLLKPVGEHMKLRSEVYESAVFPVGSID